MQDPAIRPERSGPAGGMPKWLRVSLLIFPAMFMICVFMIGPLGIMSYVSLLERGINGGVNWISDFNPESYVAFLFDRNLDDSLSFNDAYLRIFLRSFMQAGVTTLLCLLVGFPTALWMAMQPPNRRSLLIFLVTIPFWTNLLVRNYAWIILLRANGLLSNLFEILGIADGPVNMLYNDVAIGIGLTYSFLPFMVLPIYSSLEKLDWRLVEAAYDLGADRRRALLRVIIPLCKPGIIAGCILVIIPCLGAYVTPVLLGGGKTLMIGNLIQMQFGQARNWPLGAALSFFLLAIVLLTMVFYLLRFRQKPGHP